MNSIVFTSGYKEGDDDVTAMKGHRSDVLYRDNRGVYYELNFISLERLRLEIESNMGKSEGYFADTGMVVLSVVTKDSIMTAVRELIDAKYFSTQKELKLEPTGDWFILEL